MVFRRLPSEIVTSPAGVAMPFRAVSPEAYCLVPLRLFMRSPDPVRGREGSHEEPECEDVDRERLSCKTFSASCCGLVSSSLKLSTTKTVKYQAYCLCQSGNADATLSSVCSVLF